VTNKKKASEIIRNMANNEDGVLSSVHDLAVETRARFQVIESALVDIETKSITAARDVAAVINDRIFKSELAQCCKAASLNGNNVIPRIEALESRINALENSHVVLEESYNVLKQSHTALQQSYEAVKQSNAALEQCNEQQQRDLKLFEQFKEICERKDKEHQQAACNCATVHVASRFDCGDIETINLVAEQPHSPDESVNQATKSGSSSGHCSPPYLLTRSSPPISMPVSPKHVSIQIHETGGSEETDELKYVPSCVPTSFVKIDELDTTLSEADLNALYLSAMKEKPLSALIGKSQPEAAILPVQSTPPFLERKAPVIEIEAPPVPERRISVIDHVNDAAATETEEPERTLCDCDVPERTHTPPPWKDEAAELEKYHKEKRDIIAAPVLCNIVAEAENVAGDSDWSVAAAILKKEVGVDTVYLFEGKTLDEVAALVLRPLHADASDDAAVFNYIRSNVPFNQPRDVYWAAFFLSKFAQRFMGDIRRSKVSSKVQQYERLASHIDVPLSPRAAVVSNFGKAKEAKIDECEEY
jgi:hypothetical protein